jgi:hypothetical protein
MASNVPMIKPTVVAAAPDGFLAATNVSHFED